MGRNDPWVKLRHSPNNSTLYIILVYNDGISEEPLGIKAVTLFLTRYSSLPLIMFFNEILIGCRNPLV